MKYDSVASIRLLRNWRLALTFSLLVQARVLKLCIGECLELLSVTLEFSRTGEVDAVFGST